MTNEKMLETINGIMTGAISISKLPTIKAQLEEDIRDSINKSKNISTNRVSMVKKLMKTIPESRSNHLKNQYLPYVDKYGNPLYCYIDGYRAYFIKDDLGYPKTKEEKFIDLDKVIPVDNDDCAIIDLDDLTFVVKKAKIEKVKEPKYKVVATNVKGEEYNVYFNANYLKEALDIIGVNRIWTKTTKGIALIKSEGNEEFAILCPVNPPKE